MKKRKQKFQTIFLAIGLITTGLSLQAQNNTNYGTGSGNSGYDNSCFGYNAGNKVTGYHNSFIGSHSGYSNTAGTDNTFTGGSSGYYNTKGSWNTFTGRISGMMNNTGNYNTFTGSESGQTNKSGSNNTFTGQASGMMVETGNYNTFTGAESGYNTKGSSNVFIGYKAGYHEIGSNKLYITNTDDQTPLIYGDFATDVVQINGTLKSNGKIINNGGIDVTNLSSNTITSGNIKTENLNVSIDKVADYVFEDSYELRPLEEVEGFVTENKHLPGIPSGNELKEKGMDVAEMNNLLLEKIEELTLYIIEQDKRITAQNEEIQELKNQK